MKKWEDIVKEKLEEPDKTLPESVFDEFCARRSGETAPISKPHVHVLRWVMIPAVAAGLAVALFLRMPSYPVDSIQIVDVPASSIAEAVTSDSTEISEDTQNYRISAHQSTAKAVVFPAEEIQVPETEMTKADEPDDDAISENAVDEKSAPEQSEATMSSPFIPQAPDTKTVNVRKILPAVGGVAGGGLLAALLLPNQSGASSSDCLSDSSIGESEQPEQPEQPMDILTGTPTHGFPIRVMLSTRIPISNRLGITTGLDYSLYSSMFTYSVSGDKKQLVHYVGLPVRLDWTLVSNRWLDVYVGGGIEGDLCVAAKLDGNSIEKDGLSISLLGAGGIQFNACKRIGIFVEPELSWTVPSESRVLTTYRTEHPLMFSVVSGIRINIGKNNKKQ